MAQATVPSCRRETPSGCGEADAVKASDQVDDVPTTAVGEAVPRVAVGVYDEGARIVATMHGARPDPTDAPGHQCNPAGPEHPVDGHLAKALEVVEPGSGR